MKFFKKNILIKIAGTTGAFLIIFYMVLKIAPYPALDDFLNSGYSLKVLDRDGKIIQILPLADGVRREYTPAKECPEYLKNIFIKSEDKRFYFHFGFDPIAIIRSIILNLHYKKTVSGASTITMQLVRIISPQKRTYYAKFFETINAVRLEAKLSKNKIFELWINSIPYGYRAVGIKTAAKTFFGKELYELNAGENLSLSVIPRSPEKYNPMSGNILLAEQSFKIAKKIGLDVTLSEIEKDIESPRRYNWENNAPHFINFIKTRIEQKEFISGKDFNSSLNLSLNRKVSEKIKHTLSRWSKYRVANAAAVAFDNATGEIILYIGSNDFDDKEAGGEIDGAQITNQPGSTLKPFLYALALDRGFTPATLLPDIPQDFGEENLYFPLNFSRRFNGPVRLRVALASSLNVPAVYLVTKLGVQNFIDKLISLEFDSLKDKRAFLGTGIALGNAEVSLYELTRAFSVFPRKGEMNNPAFKKSDERIFKKGFRVLSEYSSCMISDILSDNSSRILGFSPANILNTKFRAMFKTGTSNQYNNVWAVGATSEYTIGVWVGNFSGETVVGEVGNSLPASICVETLELLNNVISSRGFEKPEDVKEVEICTLSGMAASVFCVSKTKEYFKSDAVLSVCSFHKKENNRVVVNYPPEYSSWVLKNKKENTFIHYEAKEQYPKIVRPNNNSVFFIDPNIPLQNQAVKIEVINSGSVPLSLFVNDNFIKELYPPYNYFFPLKKGEWRITAKSGSRSDTIKIFVK